MAFKANKPFPPKTSKSDPAKPAGKPFQKGGKPGSKPFKAAKPKGRL